MLLCLHRRDDVALGPRRHDALVWSRVVLGLVCLCAERDEVIRLVRQLQDAGYLPVQLERESQFEGVDDKAL